MLTNQISLKIQDSDLSQINGAIEVLKNKLGPYLKTLTPDERRTLPKMGDKTIAFVTKTLDYCSQNPDFVPQFLNIDEFRIDVEAVETIRNFSYPLIQLLESLNDTLLLSGSEAYSSALLFYDSIKSAKKSNIGNADVIYNDLSMRFPGRPLKKELE